MGQGWICLHRKIKDCALIWDDKPFSRGQAWVDLLLQVNHEDKEILFNGAYKKIERGQTLTSLTKLSSQWGWSRKKTTKFLNELKMAQMLDIKSDNKSTTVTIVNYDLYQDVVTTKEPQKSGKRTAEEHQRNTNNNDITTINESNNNNPLPPSEETTAPDYNFNKYSNLENVKYILNSKTYENWEYIKNNPALWECIKRWMNYKDQSTPRHKHHYKTRDSLQTQLNKFVKNSQMYGVDEVARVVNDTIGEGYVGVVWDWLAKKKNNQKTDWGNLH